MQSGLSYVEIASYLAMTLGDKRGGFAPAFGYPKPLNES